jgi:hypothetical protein
MPARKIIKWRLVKLRIIVETCYKRSGPHEKAQGGFCMKDIYDICYHSVTTVLWTGIA